MCGICGILEFDGRRGVDPSLLQAMTDRIRHRGPDEEGFHIGGPVGLGVRRLKIIDLATGSQPLHNEDRSVSLVYNGEIYNFRELRRELEQRGHRFSTRTDGETIVHLYEERGERCVEALRGMFAFALWDARKRRLLLARDRVGIKQLYYSTAAGRLVFGSEIKCLLAGPGQDRSIDLAALREFFTYQYIPGERTIFSGIRRLPPGHVLLCEDGKVERRQYWRIEPRPRRDAKPAQLLEEFRERFEEAVRLRLVSDVPLGAFLSGGIDSSAVVAQMALLSNAPVKTFTIGYEGDGGMYDERPNARRIAERYGTEHHEFVVRPDVEQLLPTIVASFDEPFADSSAIPSYYVSQMTRQHVTVALSGLGGDEIAAGYERYLGIRLAERFEKVPRLIRERVLARWVERLPDSRSGGLGVERLKRFMRGLDYALPERYERYVSIFGPEERAQLFSAELRDRLGGDDVPGNGFGRSFERLKELDSLSQVIFTDVATYLPDDLLVLTDRLSMHHSLEVRVPFVDHELLEFAATIPPEMKLRGWTKKYLLKRAFADLVPRQILHGKKKGFSIPLSIWLRGPLRPYLEETLSEERVRRLGYFDPKTVRRLIDEHLACRHNHENKLWALLVFSVWHDIYVEQGAAA